MISADGEVRRQQVAQPPQSVSNAVLRIDGEESSTRSGDGQGTVDVDVAVLDDGIDATHPDLNVVWDMSCLKGRRDRKNGPKAELEMEGWHGTMVAGFIGALDNGFGVVGVAPGARIWSVRVVDRTGYGHESEIICGLEWVASTRMDEDPANDIEVVNMSLSGTARPSRSTGSCEDAKDAYHLAHCNVISAGVTVVVAAGNEGVDLVNVIPAAYDGRSRAGTTAT